MNTRIRHATMADLPRVRQMLVRSMNDDHGYGYRPDWHSDFDDLTGCYLLRPRAALLVAEVDGHVMGSVALKPEPPRGPNEVGAHGVAPGRVGQLVRLVVDPQARGQGLARRLVVELLEVARKTEGLDVLCLHTNGRNSSSLGFWRRSGAREVLDESTLLDDDAEYVAVHFEYRL